MKIKFSREGLFFILPFLLALGSCEKLIEIEPPIDSVTTEQVFDNNEQAEWALAGVYHRMINGDDPGGQMELNQFSAGLINLAASLSADDLVGASGNANLATYVHYVNQINVRNAQLSNAIWTSAYKTIYDINAVLDGIAGSKSEMLTDSARKQLVAEARTLRAFTYFYLVNCFGDVPLVLSIDFNKTKNLPRSSVSLVYQQIVKDLTEAKPDLKEDFSAGRGERIRINKWANAALLARVYLYTGNYAEAISNATEVIGQPDLFILEPDPGKVFLKNSNEAIWQLQQTDFYGYRAVPEAKILLPAFAGIAPGYHLSESLMNVFSPTDKRRLSWIGETVPPDDLLYFVRKYKEPHNTSNYTEYSMVLRLAEMYLVRAEATILQSASNTTDAIDDLNKLRQRAGIDLLPMDLAPDQVITAVAEERRRELFVEWGHRWFDLKRTGKASAVLSVIPYKQPWVGDFQLLYPIPQEERKKNIALTQNPEYETF